MTPAPQCLLSRIGGYRPGRRAEGLYLRAEHQEVIGLASSLAQRGELLRGTKKLPAVIGASDRKVGARAEVTEVRGDVGAACQVHSPAVLCRRSSPQFIGLARPGEGRSDPFRSGGIAASPCSSSLHAAVGRLVRCQAPGEQVNRSLRMNGVAEHPVIALFR